MDSMEPGRMSQTKKVEDQRIMSEDVGQPLVTDHAQTQDAKVLAEIQKEEEEQQAAEWFY